MMGNKVVITGLGIISSIGIGKYKFWPKLISGKDGITKIRSFDTSRYRTHKGGEIKDFKPKKYIKKLKVQDIGRTSQLAVAAAKMSMEDARIDIRELQNEKVIISMGTTMAESQIINKLISIQSNSGYKRIPSELIEQCSGNKIISNITAEFNLRGSSLLFVTSCAAGNCAITYAYDSLKSNKADVAIAGGTDAFSTDAFAGFNRLLAVAPNKCQPFSKNRKGIIVGEGAGVLLLETEQRARERSAHIYAEILGYGLSCDAYHSTIPEPDGKGIVRAILDLFRHSDIKLKEVDYINAHGTGTVNNDRTETRAIKEVFGSRARNIPLSSIKSMLGHSMGAASAIEAITCALTVENDLIPPTINYDEPDPECDLDYVPNKSRNKKVNVALSNSFGFGGNNAVLAIGKYYD